MFNIIRKIQYILLFAAIVACTEQARFIELEFNPILEFSNSRIIQNSNKNLMDLIRLRLLKIGFIYKDNFAVEEYYQKMDSILDYFENVSSKIHPREQFLKTFLLDNNQNSRELSENLNLWIKELKDEIDVMNEGLGTKLKSDNLKKNEEISTDEYTMTSLENKIYIYLKYSSQYLLLVNSFLIDNNDNILQLSLYHMICDKEEIPLENFLVFH